MLNSAMVIGLEKIATNPLALKVFLDLLNSEVSLPNIPLPTMGGHVFWTTLCESHGWKVQQNMISQHARILKADDTRIAWGTIGGMVHAFERFVELQNKY